MMSEIGKLLDGHFEPVVARVMTCWQEQKKLYHELKHLGHVWQLARALLRGGQKKRTFRRVIFF